MANEKYPEAPYPVRLAHFTELPAVMIGPDDRCLCRLADPCVNRHKKGAERCTLTELRQLDSEAISRRAWQSGEG